MNRQQPLSTQQIAYGLGWFSIGLGLAEIIFPRRLGRSAGATGSPRVLMVYGLREILSGGLLLIARRPAQWLWVRVAGDLLDLATLAPDLRRRNPRRQRAFGALAVLLAVTAVDIAAADWNSGGRRDG